MQNKINKTIIVLAFAIFGLFGATNAFAATPTISTGAYSALTQTSVNISGAYILNGGSTIDVWFDYGTTPLMTSHTAHQTFINSNGVFNAQLTLQSGTQYYYRAMGIVPLNGLGYGSPNNFISPTYPLPTVTTGSGLANSQSTATLNGYFNDNGYATQTRFEYANNSSMIGSSFTTWTNQSAHSGIFSDSISGLNSNTTYYFRAIATNAGGTATATSIVHFTTSPIQQQQNACTITSFTASPSQITTGNSTTLYYQTSNCTTLSISPNVNSTVSVNNSSVNTGILTTTTTYTLSAMGLYNSHDTAQVTVTVIPNNNNTYSCAISYFNASPSTIYGTSGYSTLSWNTTNCNNAYINGIGSVATSGSISTGNIYNTTTYTLNASGTVGSTNAQTVVTLINSNNNNNNNNWNYNYPVCTIDYFNASPNNINAGSSATISWNTSNCSSVSMSNFGSVATSGSISTGTLYATRSYVLYAYGQNSSPSIPITVTVNNNYNNYYTPPVTTTYTNYTNPTPIVYTYPTTTYTQTNTQTSNTTNTNSYIDSKSPYMQLSVKNALANVCPADVIENTVNYKNISGHTLTNVILKITLSKQLTFNRTSEGSYSSNDNSVLVNIGTMVAGQGNAVTISGTVNGNTANGDTLVTTANISFTNVSANGDSAVAYATNKVENCSNASSQTAAAFFSGGTFFPTTIGGWLLLIIIILIVVVLSRMLSKKDTHHVQHGPVPTHH